MGERPKGIRAVREMRIIREGQIGELVMKNSDLKPGQDYDLLLNCGHHAPFKTRKSGTLGLPTRLTCPVCTEAEEA